MKTIITTTTETINTTMDIYQLSWKGEDRASIMMEIDPAKLELRLRNPENMIWVPILIVAMFCLTVLLVLVFKQYPTIVSAAAAAFLTFLFIFIGLNALNEKIPKYA